MKTFKTIILAVLAVALVIFIIQNLELVQLNFLSWNLQIPLALASVIVYVLGAISGGIMYSMLRKLTRNK